MAFNVNEFASVVARNGGIQRSTLFSVDIPIPPGLLAQSGTTGGAFDATARNLRFYCYAAPLPGMQLATASIRRYGYGPVEQKPSMPLFTQLNCEFLVDGKGAIWNYFQAWLKFVCNFDARNGMTAATGVSTSQGGGMMSTVAPYELNYKNEYTVDITMTTYRSVGEKSISLTLRDAFPTFIADMRFDWGDVNGIARMPIQFTFMDWYNDLLPGDGSLSFENQGTDPANAIDNFRVRPGMTNIISQSGQITNDILNSQATIANILLGRR